MSEQIIHAYAKFYEQISEENIEKISELVTSDVHFRDPFNDIRGVEKLIAVLCDMFEQCERPKFKMLYIYSSQNKAILKWEFSALPRTSLLNGGEEFKFLGLSEVFTAESGLICEHIDYWDSGREFYEKLSVIGYFIRAVSKKLSIST